ncbi:hypothetical protein MINS_12680 [Mycolicibacterium insubricum]|uniref:Uncharacterized protein n=1 Tax=Mycolicibacterium insubricum TaxID=444597 RepID=A0A1X0D7X1_9MYCO|nr:hypothetical protein [Mycolicibacterium insubricum]MCV7081276.1 hypothetical protein [Mycolicibacterium insubricum]ORA68526.1 hypothetical protein BST26_14355 [Mycolicibacterium insubricum]BBZ65839.1 hypothetical protein MINS_12680 [Mycolicibacterium insubricum]
MTTTYRRTSRRRLDLPSLALTIIGLAFGALSYRLVTYSDINALVMVPSVVAVTVGVTHLFKREAPRDVN